MSVWIWIWPERRRLCLTLCSALFSSTSGGLFSLSGLISGLTRRFSTQFEYQQVTGDGTMGQTAQPD